MANILGIQIAGSLFGLFMIYYSFLNYKRKQFTAKEFIFWISLWVLFIVIALFPFILDPVVKSVGFLRALDLLTIIGFIFLIGAVFYTYTLTRKNQRQLEELVRIIAIKKNKK
ncbi:MAG TPA: DUF2304 domain-containing protein [Candidatus Nanoarchaeia archaeon]|nr:DUF2304 domain-containing protein [Candidatus Nanoarchaeia archaeon]